MSDTLTDVPTIEEAQLALEKGADLGSGSSRNVYRYGNSPWVFKFTHHYSSNSNANTDEFNNFLDLLDVELPEGIRIPDMYMLPNGVLAAEYIKGKSPLNDCWGCGHNCDDPDDCWYSKFDDIESRYDGLRDISKFNVLIADDGTLYVIDLEM